MPTRREFLGHTSSAMAGAALLGPLRASMAAASTPLLRRAIPSTGETLPVIGMGTSGSFEVSAGSAEYDALREYWRAFSLPAPASSIRRRPTATQKTISVRC
jgi:hypothetical protein